MPIVPKTRTTINYNRRRNPLTNYQANHGKETRIFHKLYSYSCTFTTTSNDTRVSLLTTYNNTDEDTQIAVAGLPLVESDDITTIDVDMGESFLLTIVYVLDVIKYAHIMRMKTGDIFTGIWVRVYPNEGYNKAWVRPTDVSARRIMKRH